MSAPVATGGGSPAPVGTLPEVVLAGVPLMALRDTLDLIVTNVDGWYDTPDITTNDVERVLADGSIYGPKTVRGREIVITGWAIGQREPLMLFRAALAQILVLHTPTELQVSDPWLGRSLSAQVRGAGPLKWEPFGNGAFRYEATFFAADSRIYDTVWSTDEISLAGGVPSGRAYPRTFQWSYPGKLPAGTALLSNPGNVSTAVEVLYTGPLSESRLTDGTSSIRIAAIPDGVQLLVSSDTLTAQAPGGASRASFVLPGSQPLMLRASGNATWALIGTGSGSLKLYYRGAYA